MSAATSPGTGLAYGLRRVCAAWGMARSSFYAMTSGQHAEHAGKPTEARDLDQALLVDRRPGGIALGGRGLPQGLGSASSVATSGFASGAPPDARQSALAPAAYPHDGEIITHAPNLM